MSKTVTFYYSRYKLGKYLLFNLLMLIMAGLFTWIIFPDYVLIYGYALLTTTLSFIASLFVFVFPMKLAVLDDKCIKIDHNQPILWSQIKKIEKSKRTICGVDHSIIRIIPYELKNYRKSLIQKITESSRFGMFSIPLYAMDDKSANEITYMIEKNVKDLTLKVTKPNKSDNVKNSVVTKKLHQKNTSKSKNKVQKGKSEKKIKSITKKR